MDGLKLSIQNLKEMLRGYTCLYNMGNILEYGELL